jgi:hypothetical protein
LERGDYAQKEVIALKAQLELYEKKTPNSAKDTKTGTARNRRHDWKKIKPTAGEKSTKVKSGKTYHWCLKHQAWTIHSAEDCYLKAPVEAKEATVEKAVATETEEEVDKKEMKVAARAYMAAYLNDDE